MLKKEFEERTGQTVTAEEYQKIHRIYMMTVNMDKDEFCKEWKKVQGSQIVKELSQYADHWHREYEEECHRTTNARARAKELGDKLEEARFGLDIVEGFVPEGFKLEMETQYFVRALQIIATSGQCKAQFMTPVNDHYSRTYDILLLNSNATVISRLIMEGFSLSMTEKGLSVTKL